MKLIIIAIAALATACASQPPPPQPAAPRQPCHDDAPPGIELVYVDNRVYSHDHDPLPQSYPLNGAPRDLE
jgi:hypothetical protein